MTVEPPASTGATCQCPEHDCKNEPADHEVVLRSPALCTPCLYGCML